MIEFFKYEGAGNDFIMVDNRASIIANKFDLALKLCDRHFGIGSDGLIFIEQSQEVDFRMDFYNPDGSQSFCGNGSRCSVAFAKYLNIFSGSSVKFEAIDGIHSAIINDKTIKVSMQNVNEIQEIDGNIYMHTGSPHYMVEVPDISKCNIVEVGSSIRYDQKFAPGGTNVNAVQRLSDRKIAIRTYERGVEGETLACGTGATACALAFAKKENLTDGIVDVKAVGGNLTVYFLKSDSGYNNVFLEGPAKKVFNGIIDD